MIAGMLRMEKGGTGRLLCDKVRRIRIRKKGEGRKEGSRKPID